MCTVHQQESALLGFRSIWSVGNRFYKLCVHCFHIGIHFIFRCHRSRQLVPGWGCTACNLLLVVSGCRYNANDFQSYLFLRQFSFFIGLCCIRIVEGEVLGFQWRGAVRPRINFRLWLNSHVINGDPSLHLSPDIHCFTIERSLDKWI